MSTLPTLSKSKTSYLLEYSVETFTSIMANVDGEWEFPVSRNPYHEIFERAMFTGEGTVTVYTQPRSSLPMKLDYAQTKHKVEA